MTIRSCSVDRQRWDCHVSESSRVIVDFVAKGEKPGEYRMVLVEEGPWAKPYTIRLKHLQERLYGCIDAAIEGQLAAEFPESKGARVIVQVDCYDAPRQEVEDFFQRFSAGALSTDAYQQALLESGFIRDIGFSIHFDVTK